LIVSGRELHQLSDAYTATTDKLLQEHSDAIDSAYDDHVAAFKNGCKDCPGERQPAGGSGNTAGKSSTSVGSGGNYAVA
jgi:hypothetical protein